MLLESIRGSTGDTRSKLELRESVPPGVERLESMREGVDTAGEDKCNEVEDADADDIPDDETPMRPSGTW